MIDVNRMLDESIVTDDDPRDMPWDEAFSQAKADVDAEDATKQAKSNGHARNGHASGKNGEGTKPKLHAATGILSRYLAKIKEGKLPQLCRLGAALDGIEVGPGLITVIGAPPGQGKTALSSQVMFEAVEHNDGMPAYIANAEMSFDALLRRQFCAMTRIKSSDIRFGRLTETELQELEEAAAILAPRLERVSVCDPCDHESLLDLLDKPQGLVVVDYLQKFAPAGDVRMGVNTVMATLRRLAAQGHAVLALSATKRSLGGRNDSKELDLSSFRESGEIEYNADSCYVLRDDGLAYEGCNFIDNVTLVHLKNRHDAKVDRELEFHRPRMTFSARQPVVVTEFEGYQGDDPFAGGEDDF